MTFFIGTPHTHNAGDYWNDDRNAGGKMERDDVQTCTHCQRVIKMREWRDVGAWCAKCNAPICGEGICAKETDLYGCIPFKKKLDQFVEREIKYEQHLKIAGLDAPPVPRSIIIP